MPQTVAPQPYPYPAQSAATVPQAYAAPSYPPQAVTQQPQGLVPYPPQPNNPANYEVMLDFDANAIADARLIRTFPLSQPDMNSLEIQFRGAWNFYTNKRFYEAFELFSRQSQQYPGNYLSPYWAGMSALKIGDIRSAVDWFNNSLAINPYYQPARNAVSNALNPQPPAPAPQTQKTRGRTSRRK
jgi:tetratricopeptide (TPR) repeat protein